MLSAGGPSILSPDAETSKNSQKPSVLPNKAARLGAFLETYRVLLIAEGADGIPAVWRAARAAVHGVGEAACREAACLHGLPVPPEHSHRRGRVPDPTITEFRETYEWALHDLADLYGLSVDDPDITRAAWQAAMASHPVAPSSARMRCRHDGLPLPRPGRPAGAATDLPPLPSVVCRRRGLAVFDSAWVARAGQALGPTHLPSRELDDAERLDAAARRGAKMQRWFQDRRQANAVRRSLRSLATADPARRAELVARLEQRAATATARRAHAH